MLRQFAKILLRRLSRDHKYFLLREISNELGISSVIANGPIGSIEGNLNDWMIFRRYVHGQSWEDNTSRMCIDFFKRYGRGTFVDVGANIGMVFIPVLRNSGCFGIAIEASPQNFSCLVTNCTRNLPATSYKLNGVAVGDRVGTVRLGISGTNFGDHRISKEGEIEVDLVRFDDLYDAESLPKPILVKVDIQGYEPEFLSGAAKLLNHCDAMIIEYSPFSEKDDGWIGEYDRTIAKHFTRMIRYDNAGGCDLVASSFVEVNQAELDEIKRSISARKWDHENIMLFRSASAG